MTIIEAETETAAKPKKASKPKALATVEPRQEIAARPTAESEMTVLVTMFERLARDAAVPIERIERVMDMLDRLRADQALQAFNEAMSAAQREMSPIARDSFNPQTKSKYASYGATDLAIRPIYTRHGLGVSFNEGESPLTDHIRVLAYVTKGRHVQTYHYDSPIVTTGIAGKAMMTLTHARASAVTYAKRYLVGMIFNLSTGDDTDGNAPKTAADDLPISAIQLRELEALIEEVGAKTENVCRACHVELLAEMTVAQFEKAKAKLETMRAPL